MNDAALLVRRAGGDHTLGRSLGHEQGLAAALDDDREAPPLEVERDLVGLRAALGARDRPLQDRGVERTPDPRLEPAVEIPEEERALVWAPERIERRVQGHRAR